jgi:peptide/nickel transport system permease protein
VRRFIDYLPPLVKRVADDHDRRVTSIIHETRPGSLLMWSFLLRRLLLTIPVLLGVSTLVFLLLHLVPGDPVVMMLGETAQPADIEEMRTQLGLNKPLLTQYFSFLWNLLQGDLGVSIHQQRPVMPALLVKLPATILLAMTSLTVALLIAIPTGMFAARHRGGWAEKTLTIVAFLGISLPNFWLGPMLIVFFSVRLDLLPVSGSETWAHLILPSITLGTALAAFLTRMTRGSLLEVLSEPYVRTARAKGLPDRVVYYKHALRNALIPVLTLVGLQLGTLLGGSIITEKIFAWPGIGNELFQSILRRDYPMVQGCVLIIALGYVFANLLTDMLYSVVDPRIRLGGGSE